VAVVICLGFFSDLRVPLRSDRDRAPLDGPDSSLLRHRPGHARILQRFVTALTSNGRRDKFFHRSLNTTYSEGDRINQNGWFSMEPRQAHNGADRLTDYLHTRLPDFSWYKIPNLEKYIKLPRTLSNVHKI
jgi:hypothetical protein